MPMRDAQGSCGTRVDGGGGQPGWVDGALRWSRSFGPFEGFVKVYSGCKTTPSSSVWYLIIDDDELWESCGLMSESAKRGGEPREGVRGRGRKRRGDWRTKHLRACLLCGRVWRPGRRRTCPVCHVDRSICLTCDQVAVEDRARRCATDEALRRLVKACAGDWERARRALDAAGGDVPRALARARAGRVREARQRARWSTMVWRMTTRASLETPRNGRAGIPRRGSPQWWVAA